MQHDEVDMVLSMINEHGPGLEAQASKLVNYYRKYSEYILKYRDKFALATTRPTVGMDRLVPKCLFIVGSPRTKRSSLAVAFCKANPNNRWDYIDFENVHGMYNIITSLNPSLIPHHIKETQIQNLKTQLESEEKNPFILVIKNVEKFAGIKECD